MRHTVWASALLLAVTISAPALAGAGLPRIARLDIGTYQASLLNDSPRLHTGTNTITVVVPDLPPETAVSLHFVGPSNQMVQVPLQPLVVLAGPDDGHGGHAHGGDDHDDSGGGHGHGYEAAEDAYQVQGKALLGEVGAWKATLTINGISETLDFHVEEGGPSRLFLAFAGSVMGGSIIYGVIERRRLQRREV